MMMPQPVTTSRRRFLQQSGGILFYVSTTFSLSSLTACMEGGKAKTGPLSEGHKVSLWVQIHADDHITFLNPASEMGQGSMTALAMILAEELDADWSKVKIEYSPIEPDLYGSPGWGRPRMITVGSRTVMTYYDSLRQAGAQARYVLLSNVADHWQVPVEELSTEPNTVIHAGSGRRISYGEIADFVKPLEEIPRIPEEQLKDPSEFRLIGKLSNRYDVPPKVDGSAVYAIDIQLPGMVYGVIARSPVHGSRPDLQNEEEIRSLEGVLEVVNLDHGIGILASSIHLALKAREKLEIEWSKDPPAMTHSSEEAYHNYRRVASEKGGQGRIMVEEGNVDNAFSAGVKTYSCDYKNDYIYHAQMEPLNAIVSLAGDGQSAEVWAGTQNPAGARSAVAEALGMETEQVQLHPQYLGGGFGRRSTSDYIVEAALLARAAGSPVKLIWTREDDLQYGMFRPMSLQRMQASVDDEGSITGWRHFIVGTGDGLLGSGAETGFYTIPNQHIEVRNIDHGIRTKHWRAVGHGPNKFAIEAFIDEIAVDQGIDPLEFRLRLMKDHPRAKKVLQTVAEMADWENPGPAGRAKGIAFAERSQSLAACVCELSLTEENQIRVHRIWAALDAGVVVQPDNAIAQMEGGLLMGLSSVLTERLTIEQGRVRQSNFHDYPILRADEIPEEIQVKLIPSKEAPTGIGESGIPIIGGAVANAFAALTGKRLRYLPFRPEKVKLALEV